MSFMIHELEIIKAALLAAGCCPTDQELQRLRLEIEPYVAVPARIGVIAVNYCLFQPLIQACTIAGPPAELQTMIGQLERSLLHLHPHQPLGQAPWSIIHRALETYDYASHLHTFIAAIIVQHWGQTQRTWAEGN